MKTKLTNCSLVVHQFFLYFSIQNINLLIASPTSGSQGLHLNILYFWKLSCKVWLFWSSGIENIAPYFHFIINKYFFLERGVTFPSNKFEYPSPRILYVKLFEIGWVLLGKTSSQNVKSLLMQQRKDNKQLMVTL